MARNNNFSAKDIKGVGVRHSKNQSYYVDRFFTRKTYAITNNRAASFSNWQMRGYFSVLATCLLMILKINTFIAIGVGAVVYVGLELYFHLVVLKSYPTVEKLAQPRKNGETIVNADYLPSDVLRMFAIIFFTLAIFIALISFELRSYTGVNKTIALVFVGILLFAALLCVSLYIRKKKTEK